MPLNAPDLSDSVAGFFSAAGQCVADFEARIQGVRRAAPSARNPAAESRAGRGAALRGEAPRGCHHPRAGAVRRPCPALRCSRDAAPVSRFEAPNPALCECTAGCRFL